MLIELTHEFLNKLVIKQLFKHDNEVIIVVLNELVIKLLNKLIIELLIKLIFELLVVLFIKLLIMLIIEIPRELDMIKSCKKKRRYLKRTQVICSKFDS